MDLKHIIKEAFFFLGGLHVRSMDPSPPLCVERVLEGVFAFIRTTSNGHKNNFQILLGCLYSAEFHHSCSIHIKLLGLKFVHVYAHKPHKTFDRHKNVFQHLTWFCVL